MTDNDKVHKGRRAFAWTLITGIVALATDVGKPFRRRLVDWGCKIAPSAVLDNNICLDDTALDFVTEYLSAGRRNVSIIPASNNENVQLRQLGADTDTLRFTKLTLEAGRDIAPFFGLNQREFVDFEGIAKIRGEGNLISFGSPTSNMLARQALGYSAVGGGRAAEFVWHPRTSSMDGITLPFRFALDGREILRKGRYPFVVRTQNGLDRKIPNWGYVNVSSTTSDNIITPEIRGNRLVEDFLLITNMPNIFDLRRGTTGENFRIVNVGGTHGAGTAAFRLLLINNNGLRERLRKDIDALPKHDGASPYWQAVITVGLDGNSNPRSLLHHKVREVQVREEPLRRYIRRIHKRG